MKKIMHKGIALLSVIVILTVLGTHTVFAYQAAPVAVTKQATFVTEKSAKLNGQANPNEMPDTNSWFEWGISGRTNVVYETPHQGIWGGNTLIDREAMIIGLAPNMQYFYREIVENGRGKDVGQTLYFTTKALPPTVLPLVIVETLSPSSLSETSATIKGYVSPHGDTATKAWFQWGTSQNLENQTPPNGVQSSAGPVETRLDNLNSGTTYFYRIVAENVTGRTLGATRVFVTMGLPPPPVEVAITGQTVPSAERGNDGVARKITTSGTKGGTQPAQSSSYNSGDAAYSLPGVSSTNRPGDIFGAFFKKKTPTTETGTSAQNQVAGVAQSEGLLGGFWGNLTGKRVVQVTIEKVGPKNVVAHTPVEYRIGYLYQNTSPATNARLKIILPSEVIYIGDNTNNELLLEDGGGGERTYVLPIGRIEKGTTRTFSVLGMTTGDAKSFPDARARMEYDGVNGTQVVIATSGALGSVAKDTKTTSSSGGTGWLPSSLFGWVLYTLLIILSIIGIRKGRTCYQERKAMIKLQEEENDRARTPQFASQPSGNPQGA